jgi:hypothetical protein
MRTHEPEMVVLNRHSFDVDFAVFWRKREIDEVGQVEHGMPGIAVQPVGRQPVQRDTLVRAEPKAVAVDGDSRQVVSTRLGPL